LGEGLHIAIIGSRGIPSGYSGYEEFVEQLGARLAERGHRVRVYCRRGLFRQRPRSYRGMDLVYLPSVDTKNLSTFTHGLACALHAMIRRPHIALFVNVATAPFSRLVRLAGVKTVLNVDGMEWLRPKWSPLGRRYFRFCARIAGSCADRVVTDAAAMREIYLREFSTDSEVIAYGADLAYPRDPDRVRRLGLEPGRYFFTACRLVPDNNVDLMVRAFCATSVRMRYAIAGGTPYRSTYVEMLKRSADDRVLFLGHIDDQELIRELHCNAYGYLHGHEFGGTNPTLLKALACGNCVLALDTPFNREVIGKYGIFFPKDVQRLRLEIEALAAEPQKKERFSSSARERIRERYTWDLVADQYELLFRDLAKGKKVQQH